MLCTVRALHVQKGGDDFKTKAGTYCTMYSTCALCNNEAANKGIFLDVQFRTIVWLCELVAHACYSCHFFIARALKIEFSMKISTILPFSLKDTYQNQNLKF